MHILAKWWRELAILTLGSALGWTLYFREPEIKIETVTKTVEIEVEKKVVEYRDRVVYKDRVKTRTITKEKPSGEKVTIIEKVESNEQRRDVEAKTEVSAERSRIEQSRETVAIRPSKSRYLLLGSYSLSGRSFDLGVGVRLGNLPAFATVEVEIDNKTPFKTLPQPKIGITVEF